MAGRGAAPRRRAQRPLLRVRREGGGLGPEGDGLARRRAATWSSSAPRAARRPTCPRSSRAAGCPPPTSPAAWPPGDSARRSARRRRRTGPALAGPPLRARMPVVRGGAGRERRRGRPASRARRLPAAPRCARGSGSGRSSTRTSRPITSPAGPRSPATPASPTTRASATSRAARWPSRIWRTASRCGSAGSRSCPSSRSGRRVTRRAARRCSSRTRSCSRGDTLFVDDVGRPDLGGQAAQWARDLHRTLHERLGPLRDESVVLPAHASTLAASGPLGRGGRHPRRAPPGERGHAPRPGRVRPRRPSTPRARLPLGTREIREINLGRETAAEDES